MKHFWMGLGLLLALAAASLGAWWAVERVYQPVCQEMDTASEAALSGDWTLAEEAAKQARDHWLRHRKSVAALTGHDAIEEIDGLFGLLPLYARLRDEAAWAETCRALADLAQAQAEAQRLTWWNLL